MQNKDLLVVFNIFGISKDENLQINNYISNLDSIFWHIKKNNLQQSVRVVVSAVLNSENCIEKIKKRYGDDISFFTYQHRHPCQITFNKTVLAAEKEFKEKYDGYFYISSGIVLPEIDDLFLRIIEKNKSGEYGIIQLQVDHDHGYEWLGLGGDYKKIDFSKDYNIPIGNNCNFHIGIFNHSIKDFFEVPSSDVHGICCYETCLSYVSYSLRKKYILLGDSECMHLPQLDNERNKINLAGHKLAPCGLNWGRTKQSFLNDSEGIESGLGYYPGAMCNNPVDWNGAILPHKREKYDENFLSLDSRLKFAVKRTYFAFKTEIDYDIIEYMFVI